MGRDKDGKKGRGSEGRERLAALRSLLADRERVFQAAGTFVSGAMLATTAAALVVGYGPLRDRAAELRSRPARVRIGWPALANAQGARTPTGEPATWMNAELRAELTRRVEERLSGNPFDAESMEAARVALEETGWFSSGPRLTRLRDGTVDVRGAWRVPVAAVRVGGVDRLVAGKGELLPPRYPAGGSGLKVITGAAHEPPAFGEPWLGGDVQAGLALLEYLRPMPYFDQVAGVDVSAYGRDRRLTLLTDAGNRVVWGGPPGEFSPGQAPALLKRQRLAALQRDYGRIDAGRAELDLRPEDGAYVQSPAAALADAAVGR